MLTSGRVSDLSPVSELHSILHAQLLTAFHADLSGLPEVINSFIDDIMIFVLILVTNYITPYV